MATKIKIAIIAGADAALKLKQKNPLASDSEVMKQVARSVQEIMEKIDFED